MSVQGDLKRLRRILLNLAADPRCTEIAGYTAEQVKWFVHGGIDKALKRYQSEAARVAKYYSSKAS